MAGRLEPRQQLDVAIAAGLLLLAPPQRIETEEQNCLNIITKVDENCHAYRVYSIFIPPDVCKQVRETQLAS